jgi:hypothetical protein
MTTDTPRAEPQVDACAGAGTPTPTAATARIATARREAYLRTVLAAA